MLHPQPPSAKAPGPGHVAFQETIHARPPGVVSRNPVIAHNSPQHRLQAQRRTLPRFTVGQPCRFLKLEEIVFKPNATPSAPKTPSASGPRKSPSLRVRATARITQAAPGPIRLTPKSHAPILWTNVGLADPFHKNSSTLRLFTRGSGQTTFLCLRRISPMNVSRDDLFLPSCLTCNSPRFKRSRTKVLICGVCGKVPPVDPAESTSAVTPSNDHHRVTSQHR